MAPPRWCSCGALKRSGAASSRWRQSRVTPPTHKRLRSFTTAPIGAIRRCSWKRTGWALDTVDLFEISEAFAVVAMAAMRDLGLAHEKVNVHGGACALGHPIGASGARMVMTLAAALEKYGLRRGIASICIGGGEATAMAIERIE